MPRALILFLLLTLSSCTAAPHAMWESSEGGLADGSRAVRLRQIGGRLAGGFTGPDLGFFVLATDRVSAYSFPDGSIYLTAGLMDCADDDEVAAAIAHELGHLLSDGHLHGMATLGGPADDAEVGADKIGCVVLRRYGIPGEAMANMLKLVAARTAARQTRNALGRRIERLETNP